MNRMRAVSAVCAFVAAATTAALWANQPADAQQPAGGEPPAMSPEAMAMMQAFAEAGRPGVQHELLKQLEGTWEATVSMWMPGEPEPMVSTGTMRNTMVHDGRYLSHEFRGEFGGGVYTGSGMFGYNNTSKRWEGTWAGNSSTHIMFSTGTFDGRRGEWTMTSEFDHPQGYRCKQREVTRMSGPDAHMMTTYLTDKDGKEQKAMEITYKRAVEKKE